MTFRLLTYDSDGEARAGVLVEERVYDAARLCDNPAYASVLGALCDWPAAQPAFIRAAQNIAARKSSAEGVPLARVKLLAPVLYPGNIYAAGQNYTDHIIEMYKMMNEPIGLNLKELGERPWHFVKTSAGSVVGPGAQIKMPVHSKKVDWEIELAVVIGRPAKDVSVKDALDYVAGYTIANDLSARDHTRRPKASPTQSIHYDMLGGKCFDGSCPLGPWIVPASDIPDPQNLALKLWINDELLQNSSTKLMIFGAAEQIAMLSTRITLRPGDVILTGTPAGVGMGMNRYLKVGETVKLWIEGIGEMSHRMV